MRPHGMIHFGQENRLVSHKSPPSGTTVKKWKAVLDMPESGVEDWSGLDGFEVDIFNCHSLEGVYCSSERWRKWLREPLELAAADGIVDLFTRLMDAGADGSAGWRGANGRTLLSAAAYGKNESRLLCWPSSIRELSLTSTPVSAQETSQHCTWQLGGVQKRHPTCSC